MQDKLLQGSAKHFGELKVGHLAELQLREEMETLARLHPVCVCVLGGRGVGGWGGRGGRGGRVANPYSVSFLLHSPSCPPPPLFGSCLAHPHCVQTCQLVCCVISLQTWKRKERERDSIGSGNFQNADLMVRGETRRKQKSQLLPEIKPRNKPEVPGSALTSKLRPPRLSPSSVFTSYHRTCLYLQLG